MGQGNIFAPVCHSVYRGERPGPGGCLVWGGVPAGGCLLPKGCLLPGSAYSQGGACSWGCLLRGCLILGVPAVRGVPAPWGVPGGAPPMATAAGGTHPTGMHSCSILIQIHILWSFP